MNGTEIANLIDNNGMLFNLFIPVIIVSISLFFLSFLFRSIDGLGDLKEDKESETELESEEENQDEEVEEDKYQCMICGNDVFESKLYDFGETNEDVLICQDCMKDKVKVQFKDKIIEKEIIKYVPMSMSNLNDKQIIDDKYFDKVL